MVNRNDSVVVDLCKSHVNVETNPVVGVIRSGELVNMIVLFDKNDPMSRKLEVGKFAKVRVLHVLGKSLIARFEEYVDNPSGVEVLFDGALGPASLTITRSKKE